MQRWWQKWIGGGRPVEPAPTRDLEALMAPHAHAALHVVHTETRSLSHLGGVPELPEHVSWPEREGRRLGFLARLSLKELQAVNTIDWLPGEGALLFFYDLEDQPWGFDPADRGAAVVLHVPDLMQPAAPADRDDLGFTVPVAYRDVAFRAIRSWPDTSRADMNALDLSGAEVEAAWALVDAEFQGCPQHQVAGFPQPIQGDDMELECQLVTHGLYCGNAAGYQDPRAEALGAGAANWRLLFQIDSDDDWGVMWGDLGRLYFWVEEDAARRGDFSNTWLILQCS